MATGAATKTFDHEGLKAALRSAQLRDDLNHAGGQAYTIHSADDVLGAIGSYRERYGHTPEWFEWRYPQMLILGPLP